MLLQLI